MSPAVLGAVLGGALASGLLLVGWRVTVLRRPSLAVRVLPYLRDLPQRDAVPAIGAVPGAGPGSRNALVTLLGPLLEQGARSVERALGGSASVRRRLRRAGLESTVHELRIEQVVWGLVAFSATAALGVLRALSGSVAPVSWLVLSAVAFAAGVIARDTWLTSQVTRRERQVLAEFPTVAELLALAVAAGEGPVAALERVVRRSGGALSADLGRVLAAIRTGEPVADAFDRMAADTGLPLVARFAQGIAIAVERGTPLAEVLHAQASDVREAGRRQLIESAARREVLMMVPVVFLVLPVTVMFAFWPGYVGLSLTAP
ncbi:MAG: pilus assembly protein TadB [Nocardioides sp.]|nr:pilus assembly protein TadB [Nocardioides sp.]